MKIPKESWLIPKESRLNATSKRDSVSKLMKAWESKNAKRALQGAGLSTMAVTLAACGGSSDTATPAPVTPVAPVAPTATAPTAQQLALTVGADVKGSDANVDFSGNNTFTARVVQNAMGEQTNQLGTGDIINGGAGTDKLDAIVQAASPLNAGPTQAIMAEMTSVEIAEFTAIDVNGNALGGEVVDISAKMWRGTDEIVSSYSDADLRVYDVNTLNATDAFGAIGQQTGTMTVRMEFTGNNGQGAGKASDMTVLFDEDYIITGSASSASSATFYILDQDGALQGGAATPLTHTVNAAGQFDAAGTTRIFTQSEGIGFTIGTTSYSVALTAAQKAAAIADANYTHADFVADLAANATAAGIPVTITLDTANLRTTFLDNGAAYSIPGILVTSATGGEFSGLNFVDGGNNTAEFNELGRFSSVDPTSSSFTEINVELLKAGRDGDGGNLIIGGMEDDGIEIFHVTVEGRDDQPSSLASLASTNNKLETVNVEAAAAAAASLEIGNSETVGAAMAALGGVTTAKNNALVDVKTFNAAEFDNGATVHASVTDASVAKYMIRTDNAANPSADNAAFAYTSGDGNDTFNINISKANLAASGTANREDFSMSVSTGAGNDLIQMQIGDGAGTATDAWFVNHVLMDANADSRIGVDAGAGNDTVHTNGATAFRIDLGAGNDAVYTDNSGASKAVWVLNADNNGALQSELLTNLRSDANDSYALFQQTVNVTYKGLTVSQVITDFNTTDLEMNNIIKGLIAGDVHLNKLIVAEDGPGNTLIVRSLIDGVQAAGDFAVSLTANTAITGINAPTIEAFNTANGTTVANAAALQTAVNNAVTAWRNEGDYDSELATLSGGSNARDITVAGDHDAAAATTTVTIGGVVTVIDVAAGQAVAVNAATQATNIATALNGVDGLTAAAVGAVVTVTAATGEILSDIVVASTATDGGVAVTHTLSAETAVVEATGANSTAANANTITDGTGNDTIVLSTEADSSETVVLVLDGVNDLIVNFEAGAVATGGDVIDFGGTLKSISGVSTVNFQANATAGNNLDAIAATTTVYEIATQTTDGTAADLVAELGTAATNANIDAGDALLFIAYTAEGLTQIWSFVDANGANIDAAELTLEATLTDITADALIAANFI